MRDVLGHQFGVAGRHEISQAATDERFAFDTFVAGPSNEFAFAVARRVASWADGHFNPVLFHGPYGFGKTHLLNAVAAEATRAAPDKKVVYLTAERFLSTFVKAIQDRSTAAFKDELRTADLLLIDDVHFIGGKQSSQEELFHTLMALMSEGRRVVLSADRPPAALTEVDARLRSHLSAGLVCGIEPADRRVAGAVCAVERNRHRIEQCGHARGVLGQRETGGQQPEANSGLSQDPGDLRPVRIE